MEDLHDVACRNGTATAVEPAGDVHETGDVATNDRVRLCRLDRVEFPFEHGRRDIGHLEREQTSEPAAFGGTLELLPLESRDGVDELLWLIFDAQVAKAVARVVHGAGPISGCTDVIDTEVVDEERRQFAGPCGNSARRVMQLGIIGDEFRDVVDDHVPRTILKEPRSALRSRRAP